MSLRLPQPENEVEAMPECLHWIHAYDRHNVKIVDETNYDCSTSDSTQSESLGSFVQTYGWQDKEKSLKRVKKIKLSDNVVTLNSPFRPE